MPDDKAEHDPFAFNPFAAPEIAPAAPPIVANPEPEEPAAASMSRTKAELLDRLALVAADLTKAEILEHITRIEGGNEPEAAPVEPARVYSTTARTATIDGQSYSWTEASEDTVPQAAREIWAQAQAAGG